LPPKGGQPPIDPKSDLPLVKGKHVTGFTNGEEGVVNLTHVVPFLAIRGSLV
jgi:hypothetical protein